MIESETVTERGGVTQGREGFIKLYNLYKEQEIKVNIFIIGSKCAEKSLNYTSQIITFDYF